MTREQWLENAVSYLWQYVLDPDKMNRWTAPIAWRVTCGLSQRSRSVRGQCFAKSASADGVNEIFINPGIDDSQQVLRELLWQYARACVDGKQPINALKDLGLTRGDNKIAVADDMLAERLRLIGDLLPEYPHARLTKSKKDGTRQLKVACDECGAIWRSSAKHVRGMRMCPCCGSPAITKPPC